MKHSALYMILIGLILGLGLLSYYNFGRAASLENELRSEKSYSSQLEKERKDLSTQLEAFKVIDKKDLLSLCSSRASDNYSNYLKSNSITETKGSITTITPKTPDVLKTAESKLQSDQQACQEKYGS